MSLYIYLALKCFFIAEQVIKIFNQLVLNDFLFWLCSIILYEKYTINSVSVLVEYNSIIKLAIIVLGLVYHALYWLEIA